MLRLVLLAVVAILVTIGTVRADTAWPALLDTAGIRERLATPALRIVDLRTPEAYAEGHADGAVSMPMAEWRAADAEDRLAQTIGAAGISSDRPILLVHDDGSLARFAEAAWVAWQLEARGIDQVGILSGGMAAWQQDGIRTTTRIHRHRVYNDELPVIAPVVASEAETLGIRLGALPGRLLGVRADATRRGGLLGLPSVEVDALIGEAAGPTDPVSLLERLKSAPVPWQVDRVVLLGESVEIAAAFWFLASEIAGIRGLAVVPGPVEDIGLAQVGLHVD